MSISDADFLEWITSQRSVRTVLVEYSYDSGTMGYASNRPYVSKSSDTPASTPYDEIIVSDILYKRSVSWDLSLAASASKGNIEFYLTDELENLVYADFYNAQITVLVGDSTWFRSDFRVMMKGICAGSKFQNRRLILAFKDDGDLLNRPFDFDPVTQSSGEIVNKPISFGYVFNATPVTVDTTTDVYQISNGQVDSIDAKDNGVIVTETDDLTNGKFTLSVSASGQITSDIIYHAGTLTLASSFTNDYSVLPVVEYIFKNHCGIDTTDLLTDLVSDYATFVNSNGSFYDSGYYVNNSNITKLQVVNDLLRSIGFFWYFTREGVLQFSTLNTKSTVFADWHTKTPKVFDTEIIENSIKLTEVVKACAYCSASCSKNWTPMSSIASSITGFTRDHLAKEFYQDKTEFYGTVSPIGSGIGTISYPPMYIENNPTELKIRAHYHLQDKFTYELDTTNAYQYEIGDVVEIEYEEFGFYKPSTNEYTVLFINENIMTGMSTMGIMCDKL